jgi:ABC-type sugar transport system permease subunit
MTKLGQYFKDFKKSFTKEELRKKYNFEDRNAFLFCYLCISLPFIFFLVFFVYVNIDQIWIAFTDPYGNPSFENFERLWEAVVNVDDQGWNLLEVTGRSVSLYFMGWIFWFPGMLSCYILYKKIWGHYVYRTIFMIPSVLGGLAMVMIYKYMLMPGVRPGTGGPLLMLANNLFDLPDDALRKGLLSTSETAWITLLCLHYIPHIIGFNMVQTGAYARIPNELFEVGRIDGMSFIREFVSIGLPLTWSTLCIGFTTGIAGFFTGDVGVFLYTQGQYDTATMGFYIYWRTFLIAENGSVTAYGYPAALGLTVTALTIPLVFLVRKITGMIMEDVTY